MSKLMLLGSLGAFSCAGAQLDAVDTEIGPAVDVPDEFVEVALALGLIDLNTESDRLIAEADEKVEQASEAVAKSKAAKASKALTPAPAEVPA